MRGIGILFTALSFSVFIVPDLLCFRDKGSKPPIYPLLEDESADNVEDESHYWDVPEDTNPVHGNKNK